MKRYLVNLFTTEKNMEEQLCSYIQQKGWAVLAFSQPEKALLPRNNHPNIWIVDVTVSAYGIIKTIKKAFPATPVLVIGPATSIADRVIALEFGSDDCLSKPFSPEEVVLRVERLLTRGCSITHHPQNASSDKNIVIGPYKIDIKNRTIIFGSENIPLTIKEFELVLLLHSNRGHTLTREQILQYAWRKKIPATRRSVDDVLYRLRKKLPELPLDTCYGKGFKLPR